MAIPRLRFVLACFADEGPTLRRFAARARGRGTRINKRTCHITVIVARLSDDRIAVLQAKDANRTAAGRRRGAVSSTAARRDRVERSRERAQGLASESTELDDAEVLDEVDAAEDSAATDEVITDTLEAVAGNEESAGDEPAAEESN